MNNMGVKRTDSVQPPFNVSVYKPSGISSIFNWFGKKNKNELSSSVIGKNCFKFKLNSLDLDSLKINSDDMKLLKKTLKMKQNGPRANIFRIPKNQLGMKEDEFFSKVIAPNLVKSKKGQGNKEKCVWSTSSLSITSKQKTHKSCNVRTIGRMKSHKSLVKSSLSNSKTTLKVHYKQISKLNIPKPTYKSILMKSIPPNILKSNIENPVFVPVRCIGKTNTDLVNKAFNEPNCIEQAVLDDLETKTKVIPVLMKKIKSMEDQISTISSTTKQIEEVVSHQNVLSKLYSKKKERADTPLTVECPQSHKILPNTSTKKSKRVKAKSVNARGKRSALNRSPLNSASESCKDLNFVFEPKARVFSAFNTKDETQNPFFCQTLSKEAKFVEEANEPIKTLFDAYPNVGCDTILKMYKDLSEENDDARPSQDTGHSHHQIDLNKGSESNQYSNLFKGIGFGEMINGKDVHKFLQQFYNLPSLINGCEDLDLTDKTGCSTKSLIDLSVPLEKNSLPVDPSNKAESNEKVLLGESGGSKCTEVPNRNLITGDESCPQCGSCIASIIIEELNYKTDEGVKDGNDIVMKDSMREIRNEPLELLTDSQQSLENYKSCENFIDTGTKILPPSQVDVNADTSESDKCHDTHPENIFNWIQNACSKKDNKPEVSIMIQVKDDNKCLVLESLSPKLLNADTNEKLIDDGVHKETVGDRYTSEVNEPKMQSYNTRSILTTSQGVNCDNDRSKFGLMPLRKHKEYTKTFSTNSIPLKTGELEKKNRPFHSLENMKPVKSFEFESAGRGDVQEPTTKACWSPVEKEISDIGKEETYLVFHGECGYLDRNKRAIFDKHIRSKTSISETDNPSPKVSLVHFLINNGIGDSTLESFDTKHYRLDSDNFNSEYPCLMQLGDTSVIKNMSSEMLKSQDDPRMLASHHEATFFQYDSVLGNSPRGMANVEHVIPKLTQSSKFFRCIETNTDLEMDPEIKFDSKRRPRRCGLKLLQDIEEILDESEEETEGTVDNDEREMGDSIEFPADECARDDTKYIAEYPMAVPDVKTRNSSVSVQTDWSLIGITVDHFHSSTCLAKTGKPSVGCQTEEEEMTDDVDKLVLSNGLLADSIESSKFCKTPSGTSLRHPCLRFDANSSGENTEMKMSELFLNVIRHNSELDNNVIDLDTAETLGNFDEIEVLREFVSMVSANESSLKAGFQDIRSYEYETNSPSDGYKSDTKHTCSHPCFPSFSDETIDSTVDILGSDAFIERSTYGFLPNVSLINSDIINVCNNNESDSTHPHVLSENFHIDSLAKRNSDRKVSSLSRFPVISNVASIPQTTNDNVDVFRFGLHEQCSLNSETICENLINIVDSTPAVASVVKMSDQCSTKTEETSVEENGADVNNQVVTNSYVVNYLYKIEYDISENTICHYK